MQVMNGAGSTSKLWQHLLVTTDFSARPNLHCTPPRTWLGGRRRA